MSLILKSVEIFIPSLSFPWTKQPAWTYKNFWFFKLSRLVEIYPFIPLMTRDAGKANQRKSKGVRENEASNFKTMSRWFSDKVFWFFLPQNFLPSLFLGWWKSKVLFLLKEFFSDYVLGKRKTQKKLRRKKDGEGKKFANFIVDFMKFHFPKLLYNIILVKFYLQRFPHWESLKLKFVV